MDNEPLVVLVDSFLGKDEDETWHFEGRRHGHPDVRVTFATRDETTGKSIRDSLLAGQIIDFGCDPELVEAVEVEIDSEDEEDEEDEIEEQEEDYP